MSISASDKTYTKNITFSSDSTVDISSLTIDEKKLLLQSVAKDGSSHSGALTSVDDVEKFLLIHDENRLQDLGVEEMRRIIPKLIMYSENRRHSASCRKVKGLWDKAPVSWPAEVPFMDPNNRKRTKTEGGGKKPTKQEILPMLIHLFRSCKEKYNTASAAVSPASELHSPLSCQSTLSSCDDSCSRVIASVSSSSMLSVDDVAMDTDCMLNAAADSCSAWQSLTLSTEDDNRPQTSSDTADMRLHTVYQCIIALPPSDDQELMMQLYGMLKKQNEIELTAEQLTELKQDVSALVTAASQRHQFESSRSTLLTIKAKYSLHSSLRSTDVPSSVVKTECLSERPRCDSPGGSIEQPTALPSSIGDPLGGNVASQLTDDDELWLTDISEVIDCDMKQDCRTSLSLPSFELKSTIAATEVELSCCSNVYHTSQ